MAKTFVAAFIGRVLAALLIAVCAALGFGPKEWAAVALRIDISFYGRVAFILLAIITAVILIWPSIGPKVAARSRLRLLRTGGIPIRNNGITLHPKSWDIHYRAWSSDVLRTARRISDDLADSLRQVNKIRPNNQEAIAVNDPGHQKNVSKMSEMIVRIEEYLAKGIIYGHDDR